MLVAIRLDEVDVECCQIRITQGKGDMTTIRPFLGHLCCSCIYCLSGSLFC